LVKRLQLPPFFTLYGMPTHSSNNNPSLLEPTLKIFLIIEYRRKKSTSKTCEIIAST